MCGIVGIFKGEHRSSFDSVELVRKMASAIEYRGPDDSGEWFDPDSSIALAHRRLSILDLSPAGHQPMVSHSGRYVLVFNGEIYNHQDIRNLIENVSWRGHSDTETILAGFEKWGIKNTVSKLVGMFAIAVWDRDTRTLTLARDRIGEKPLYYGWQGNTFLFGSELKSLKVHPAFKAEIDRDALGLYVRCGYVNAPYSIYKGIFKLPPGTIVTLKSSMPTGCVIEPDSYWSLCDEIQKGKQNPFRGTPTEAIDKLEELLLRSVSGQMISDVPLGAFLSGGIDSSTIVGLMQARSSKPIKTFTIGFSEKDYDEAIYAKKIAKHLGTDHSELYLSPKEVMDIIPLLSSVYDEPFGDSSALPTILVSRFAKQKVTVSLSGDGGDELFGGYRRYEACEFFWKRVSAVPHFLRSALAPLIGGLSSEALFPILSPMAKILNYRKGYSISERMETLSIFMRCRETSQYYQTSLNNWRGASPLLAHSDIQSSIVCPSEISSFTEQMMYSDMMSYLPGDILTKVDRASMAVSLETRVPLLDHRVVEFVWSLPFDYKVRHGQSKWILRQILDKYVPRELMDRPKMGFGVPVDHWIRGPFKDWANDLLSEEKLKKNGFFSPGVVRKRWLQHLRGDHNWKDSLWNILSFQSWIEKQ